MSSIEDLFVTKEQTIGKLVEKSKGLVGIEKDKKEILFLVSKATLTDRELIGLYLLGKFFLAEVGLADNSIATLNEISEKTGLDKKAISKRISDMRKEGLVISPARTQYEIEYTNAEIFLDELVGRYEGYE